MSLSTFVRDNPSRRVLFLAFLVLSVHGFTPATSSSTQIGNAATILFESSALGQFEEKRVLKSIEQGVHFLRRTQYPTGSWAIKGSKNLGAGAPNSSAWLLGYACLPALALLESGADANDLAISRAAAFVRAGAVGSTKTYEIALALMFLDRLGAAQDRSLIRTLGLRLAGGQRPLGGWGYDCAVLQPIHEKQLFDVLEQRAVDDAAKEFLGLDVNAKAVSAMLKSSGDHSNTQFAIMALSIARKYGLPLGYTLGRSDNRFRSSQTAAGWGYNIRARPSGAMTCVGLLGIVSGAYAVKEGIGGAGKNAVDDQAIRAGLAALGSYLNDPSDSKSMAMSPMYGPNRSLNFYFLWSVERVGVLYNLKTIGGRDWYRWGADLLLPAQRPDGSWLGRGNGGSPVIDTSMALLFLKKSDLLPDLRETLQKRLTITDPGAAPKSGTKEAPDKTKSPGDAK